jgi:ABC-type antimicrobial peptide transport system permease subunit
LNTGETIDAVFNASQYFKTMIRNYFLVAWRVITRNTVYAIINVLGLTLGLSACIIVYLVVSHELSFDRFHPDVERIYRVQVGDEVNPGKFCTCVQAPAYQTLRDEFTGAESITGYHMLDAKVTIPENDEPKHFDRNSVRAILTDAAYFKLFHYEWLAGEPNVLSKPLQVVLTESRARAYFGSIEPKAIVGKSIVYNDSLYATIAGVVKDWTQNSDFAQTEFISFSTIENTFLRELILLDKWGITMHTSQSLVKLKSGDDPVQVARSMVKTLRTKTKDKILVKLEPLTSAHFHLDDDGTSSLRSKLRVLTGLAAFILVIAAFNFINLSTAQSIKRTKEIGLRKVMGGQRSQLVFQFLSETFILAAISLHLSLVLIRPLMLLFSDFVPPNLQFNMLSISNWIFLIALLLITTLVAGIYPAFIVSSREPALSLSTRTGVIGHKRWPLRKVLIVLQFSFSFFFIIATLVISSQMDFIRNEDRGFSTESVLTFRTNWNGKVSTVKTLAERLRMISHVEEVSTQGFNPMGFAMWQSSFEYIGKEGKVDGSTSIKVGDEHYIPLYKIRLLAGRNFGPTDSLSKDVVVNEAFVKLMGIKSAEQAIGEQFKVNGSQLSVCGVVSNFHEGSFRMAIGPCVIMNVRGQQHAIALRLENSDPGTVAKVNASVESEFKRLYPDETYSAHFVEDEIGWLHADEQKTSSLATIAMIVTIAISCLGVFGLAMFTATMRSREIGIRKVLGSSVTGIVKLLSKEFIILIALSIVLAAPVAWYQMNSWLLGFPYRAELNWWQFVVAAIISFGIGLATVSFQSVRAAMSDPIEAIKTE